MTVRAPRRLTTATCVVTILLAAACDSPAASHPFKLFPTLKVLASAPASRNGDIFLTPHGGGYQSGPEIISPTGKVIWFHPLPAGQMAADFRTQTYRGRPVLTWCQFGGHGSALNWTDYIYSDSYHRIAAVRAADGYATDYHEFLITPADTALITATTTATADLSSIGGPAAQTVIQDAVQEIDIRTGQVLFQWNAADHVPYRDSHLPIPESASTPWDWFHINAAHLDTDGNLLINSRFTWATYKVSRHAGHAIWQLGGKHSTFKLRAAPGQELNSAGAIFAYQHDPEALGHGLYTLFDDEAYLSTALLPHSRAVVIRLDLADRTATLLRSDDQPAGLLSRAQGNAQTTGNGDLFVGWGTLPYVSEFSSSGRLVFNATLPAHVGSYRAYRLPWHPAAS
jgi:Arylsulfotransferase (ASST)